MLKLFEIIITTSIMRGKIRLRTLEFFFPTLPNINDR
jgi:hypothetical protein